MIGIGPLLLALTLGNHAPGIRHWALENQALGATRWSLEDQALDSRLWAVERRATQSRAVSDASEGLVPSERLEQSALEVVAEVRVHGNLIVPNDEVVKIA